ncbi:MAG: hypothetical protein QNK23_13835 [Crocinitomicaceae bacterium]|nr:hypothetical protein [Crocinitomicaceae bacterium]
METEATADIIKKVTFIQYDIPPLKAGEYTLTVEQKVKVPTGDNNYTSSKRFAVTGERFSFDPSELNSVFPQNHANGEFSKVFPQVVFNRRTLPWERSSVKSDITAPWLAVLLFNEGEQPEVTEMTASDLVPDGTRITVEGSSETGTGKMPANYFSYPGFSDLDYGETPADKCNVIDIDPTDFSTMVPTSVDLPYLAHIRETQTIDKVDSKSDTDEFYAVVMGNRIPKDNANSYAYLVSLENMGDELPGADGTSNLPSGTSKVRLIVYKSWNFTVNTMDETFKNLLENLNKSDSGVQELTTLQYPYDGSSPSTSDVQAALANQASGSLNNNEGTILVHNALDMGYLPMNEHLRHSGNTVSWYRGPFAPYSITNTTEIPISCPDAANKYNAFTGLFDVSYGSAWQLGQLLALQNQSFSVQLYNWKKKYSTDEIIAAEQEVIDEKLKGIDAFGEVLEQKRALLAETPELPKTITGWLSELSLLKGVPFNYLVPDSKLLPIESLRFFTLDLNWIDHLIDGAFSIGRSTVDELKQDAKYVNSFCDEAKKLKTSFRRQKAELKNYASDGETYTGFILRSAVVAGWPGIEANGYSDTEGTAEIPKLRMEHLNNDTLICIFDGDVKMVALHEPPEALHGGLEGTAPNLTTTLREVNGNNPGHQFLDSTAAIPLRNDEQTVKVSEAATSILDALNAPPLDENVTKFTSAEYALEMIKGVVKVEYINKQ